MTYWLKIENFSYPFFI